MQLTQLTRAMNNGGGRALRILDRAPSGKGYAPNEEALREFKDMLMQPEFVNCEVSVLSMTGPTRVGKSSTLVIYQAALAWMEAGHSLDDPFWTETIDFSRGFEWRSGDTYHTTGIFVWSRPYLIAVEGRKIAVILMDTQGSFDHTADRRDWASVFAFSTLLASTQILNVRGRVNSNDFDNLDTFTMFGMQAVSSDLRQHFQRLVLLVRDYNLGDRFGFEAGRQMLATDRNVDRSQLEVRQRIDRAFKTVECFALPYPGKKAARGTWNLPDVEKDFLEEMRLLISATVGTVKEANGENVTCSGLLTYIRAYMTVFNSATAPHLTSFYEATRDANNAHWLRIALESYCHEFQNTVNMDGPDEADRRLRGPIIEQLLSKLIEPDKTGDGIREQLYSMMNGFKAQSQSTIERRNRLAVESSAREFYRDLMERSMDSSVDQCFETCRAQTLDQLDSVLVGGVDMKQDALNRLRGQMEEIRLSVQSQQTTHGAIGFKQHSQHELEHVKEELRQYKEQQLHKIVEEKERAEEERREGSRRARELEDRLFDLQKQVSLQQQQQPDAIAILVAQLIRKFVPIISSLFG